jgi:ABC-type branched-subunit amino acid transport system substrate-binding protein
MAAREMYDAVRLLAVAVRRSGPNRARVRDYLTSGEKYSGVSSVISFDKAGNFQGEFGLQELPDAALAAAF